MTTNIKAKDIMHPVADSTLHLEVLPSRTVHADMSLPDLLAIMLDTPEGVVGVSDGSATLGVVDRDMLLRGLGQMITPRDDSSLIVVRCAPAEYSATSLAHAVEDAEANLVDLWTRPGEEGDILVTLRVTHSDPSACVHHLERYGFEVVDAMGSTYADADMARERLMQLQALLSV
ncbi:MAG: hypothetical protein NC328_07270 [Muribaculum sp.]|nr:hypothetical protein [Muribaculum sp.]